MKVPSKEKALEYLQFAKSSMMQLGVTSEMANWYEMHCINVSKAAKVVAEKHNKANADTIEVMGLLHDIGKYEPEKIVKKHHAISGYEFMLKEGYPDIANICLTHIFPFKHFSKALYDLMFKNKSDIDFSKEYLTNTEYTAYDEIIQLVDMMSLANGFVTIEQRYDELVKRYGREDMRENQPIYNRLKNKIDKEICHDVYTVLGIAS